jgi:hypothetical protein
MAGRTYPNAAQSTYYKCPHDPSNLKYAADTPDHPLTVQAPETSLDKIVGAFFATRIFGPGRAALPADPADTAAAMRIRIRARFAELHHEREQIQTQLAALDKTTPAAANPALLDQLPIAGDILTALPAALKTRLFQAFDLEIQWNKPAQQATVFAEITENTLRAIPAILDPGQDGYHDPDPGEPIAMGDLFNAPLTTTMSHRRGQAARDAGGAVTGAPAGTNRPGGAGTSRAPRRWRPRSPRCRRRSGRPA